MSNLKKKDIFLSIIIPTKNEEKYIKPLLKSIKEQKNYNFNYEIIVADANSEDKTIEISKRYGCKIINGGTPAVGKNNGAKVSKGKYLLFLDADCKLNPNSFNKWFNNINYNIGKPYLSSLENNSIYDEIINLIFFKSRYITYNMYNAIDCVGLIIKKEFFNKVGGFNEKYYISEDLDLTKRLAKIKGIGKRKHLHPTLLTSNRRIKKEGVITMFFRYMKIWNVFNKGIIMKKTEGKKIYDLDLYSKK